MKSTFRHIALASAFFICGTITSCGKTDEIENQETEQSGTFMIDGVEYKGKTSVQTFTNGNYSILCEQDSPYKFIQITFHSQAEAEKGGSFKAGDYEMNIPSGQANVGIDGLTFDPVGDYKINVADKQITLSTLKLKETGGASITADVQSASISF